MNQLLITYPGKARTYPIGETKGHSMLYVIELSDSLENSHLKPAIKVCVLKQGPLKKWTEHSQELYILKIHLTI
jgi:hypothetical protein